MSVRVEQPGKPTEYHIRTVSDFLEVPEDRREVCVSEFLMWLSIYADAMVLLSPAKWDGVFQWIDDGERNVRLTLTAVRAEK